MPSMALPTSKLERPNTVDLHLGGWGATLRTPLALVMRGAVRVVADPPGHRLTDPSYIAHWSITGRTIHIPLPFSPNPDSAVTSGA